MREMENRTKQFPLEGLLAVELSTVVAAPTAARMLCAYGAEVVKIEQTQGDNLRYLGRLYGTPIEDYKNPIFTIQNSNKRLISVDLKTEAGKEILKKLLCQADVFITNVRQSALERLELSYEQIKEEFPNLIYAHLTSYGSSGPLSGEPGFDTTAFWMRTGAMSDWTALGDIPFAPAYGFGDTVTASFLLNGILMALLARKKTKKGTYVTTSLFASGIWSNGGSLVMGQFLKRPMRRNLDEPASMFVNLYKCKDDKWLGLYSVDYVRSKNKFAEILNMKELIQDPRYENYDTLCSTGALQEGVKSCQKIFRTKTAEEWRLILKEYDIPCEIEHSICQLCSDEQAAENKYVGTVAFADGLNVIMPTTPVFFSEYDMKDYQATGGIGVDTREVLSECGYDEEQIEELIRNRVVKADSMITDYK